MNGKSVILLKILKITQIPYRYGQEKILFIRIMDYKVLSYFIHFIFPDGRNFTEFLNFLYLLYISKVLIICSGIIVIRTSFYIRPVSKDSDFILSLVVLKDYLNLRSSVIIVLFLTVTYNTDPYKDRIMIVDLIFPKS